MADLPGDLGANFAILTGMSLIELRTVDDGVLKDALDQILHGPGKTEDRLWSQGGCVP